MAFVGFSKCRGCWDTNPGGCSGRCSPPNSTKRCGFDMHPFVVNEEIIRIFNLPDFFTFFAECIPGAYL